MFKTTFKNTIIFVIVFYVFFGCTPQNDENDDYDEPVEIRNNMDLLNSLGIPISIDPLKDPNGTAIADEKNPLGKTLKVMDRYSEFITAGFGNNNFSINNNPGTNGSEITFDKGDTGWATLPKKIASGDIDGDGIDEVLCLVYHKGSKFVIYTTKYNVNTNTYSISTKDIVPDDISWDPDTDDYQADKGLLTRNKYFLFDLKMGDINMDGKAEILLTYHNRLYIYDGSYNAIAGKVFNTFDYNGGYSDKEEQFLRVDVGDITGNGVNEIVVVHSMYKDLVDNPIPACYIYNFENNSLTHKGMYSLNFKVDDDVQTFITANVALGDVDGQGAKELCFFGRAYGATYNNVSLYVTKYNPSDLIRLECIGKVHNWDSGNSTKLSYSTGTMNYYWGRMYGLATANLEGNKNTDSNGNPIVGREVIIAGCDVFYYNGDQDSAKSLEKKYGDYALTGETNYHIFADQIIAGNFNNNQYGQEQIIFIDTHWNDQTANRCIISWIDTSGGFSRTTITGGYFEQNYYPAIGEGNIDNDSPILQYNGRHETGFSNPILVAILASSPYYSDIEYGDNLGGATTNYGESKSTSQSDSNKVGFKVGFSIEYEHEFSVPLTSIKIAGWGFEVSVENSFSWEFGNTKTISTSKGFVNPAGQNSVVVTVVPYEVYFYKIVSSPNKDEIGKEISINTPYPPILKQIELNYYNAHNGAYPDIGNEILPHTIGNPKSYYPYSKLTELSNCIGSDELELATDKISVGTGGGNSEQTIDIEEETSTTFSYELSAEFKIYASIGDWTLGVNAGLSYGYTTSTSITTGTSIAGGVPNIPIAQYNNTLDYQWALAAYSYKLPADDADQKFVVVTYLVD